LSTIKRQKRKPKIDLEAKRARESRIDETLRKGKLFRGGKLEHDGLLIYEKKVTLKKKEKKLQQQEKKMIRGGAEVKSSFQTRWVLANLPSLRKKVVSEFLEGENC